MKKDHNSEIIKIPNIVKYWGIVYTDLRLIAMIRILFSLRFQTQLRRTRPVLYKSIEDSITEAIKASGGILGFERRYITASFDEKNIGFWIDILTVVETISKTMEEAGSELYGYIAVLGQNLEDEAMQHFRLVSSEGGGIWCDPLVQKALAVYGRFGTPLTGERIHPAVAGYALLKDIHSFSGGGDDGETQAEKLFPYREKIQRILRQGENRNALLAGPRFIGKREGLRRYCVSLIGDTPPLVITFGAGGGGVSCLVDAFTQPIRAFIAPRMGKDVLEELDTLETLIGRDRFRNQHSDCLRSQVNRFLHLLCEIYADAAKQCGRIPILILENIHEARTEAIQVFTNWYRTCSNKAGFLVYGTCSDIFSAEAAERAPGNPRFVPDPWSRIFPRVLQFPSGDFAAPPPPPELSIDLCEIAYAFALFRQYFPPSQFPALFKEAGINSLMVERTLDFFSREGLVDFREDPLFRIADFIPWVEELLGERQDYIKAIVLDRVLSWVTEKKVNPCFNVLKILLDLKGEGSDTLVLDSIMGDIVNGTYQELDEVINTELFETLAGTNRASLLRYITATGKALMHGTQEDINQAFLTLPPESEAFPLYKAHIYIGMTGYYLSIKNSPLALKSVKEAMILSQAQGRGKSLVQVYRLFSLVNVSQERLNDALEYFTFAIESAEVIGIQDELTLAAYYAAGTHFLFGNIAKADRLASLAEAAAIASGRTDWADRSRFLLGRIRFETGRYQDALDIFEGLVSQCPPSSDRVQICSAWIFRTDVFLNRSYPRIPDRMNYDARLFAVEAAYLSGNYQETLTLADALTSDLPEGNFLFIEQPDWRSGFSQCELLIFSLRNFFFRLSSTYRALALCRVKQPDAEIEKETRTEAQDSLRRVLREDGMPQMDPNDAFYYYAYYCVLQETGAVEVDMNTAVSLAFKRLQSRASRIDDPQVKRSYLSLNYWNKILGQAARKHKLI
jgi:tetratricopeptide (TPR) repeat protein